MVLGTPYVWRANVEKFCRLPRMSQMEFETAFAATGFGRLNTSMVFARTREGRSPAASCDINYRAYLENCFPDLPSDYVYRRIDDDWIMV